MFDQLTKTDKKILALQSLIKKQAQKMRTEILPCPSNLSEDSGRLRRELIQGRIKTRVT